MKKSKTFSMMSIGLKLFKRIPVLSFIHVVMDLLSSVLKKCVWFDGDCERHGNN